MKTKSALTGLLEPAKPPTTSTLPLGNGVAVRLERAVFIDAAGVQISATCADC